MRDNLLYHRLHLIDLNRIYDKVFGLVVIFLGCFLEAAGSLLNAVVEDVGKAKQHGGRDIAQCQFVHHFA